MADSLKWGILATGSIARQFARSLKYSQTGKLIAIGSRSKEKADKFAEEYGGVGFGSYEEVLGNPEVQAVYVATPHHLHMADTIACAKAGKAILCEKPFTLNLLEAQRAIEAVRENNVFFMEAFMYRCHPMIQKLRSLLADGSIGTVLNINSEFGFHAGKDWDNFRADGALGGGGLMDVGSYCVSLSRLVAGCEPDIAHYVAQMSDKGYDEQGSGILKFPNGVTAHFGTGVHISLTNNAKIYGDAGSIELIGPWRIDDNSKIILKQYGKDAEEFAFTTPVDELFKFEADAVAEFIDAKQTPYMSIEDTLGQMRTLDMLRKSAGIEFAKELRA